MQFLCQLIASLLVFSIFFNCVCSVDTDNGVENKPTFPELSKRLATFLDSFNSFNNAVSGGKGAAGGGILGMFSSGGGAQPCPYGMYPYDNKCFPVTVGR